MKQNIDFIMLGDSLSARGDWEVLLYPKKVLNLGHDGDTVKGVLKRLYLIPEVKPKALFLMIGINDMSLYLSLDEIYENYIKILEELKSNGIKVVIEAILYTQMDSFNKKVKIINEKIKEYAKSNQIDFLDLNIHLSNGDYLKDEYTTDGLHLNLDAYQVWAKEIKKSFSDF